MLLVKVLGNFNIVRDEGGFRGWGRSRKKSLRKCHLSRRPEVRGEIVSEKAGERALGT